MVEIGSIIAAQVMRIEPFGVWLDYQGQKVLVLIPELSWSPIKHPSVLVQVGQTLNVKVICYNYREQVVIGSLKALQPELNPYRHLWRLPPLTVLTGKVISLAGNEVTVALPNTVWGYLPKNRLVREPKVGEEIAVVIAALNVDQGRLSLDLANPRRDVTSQPDPPIGVRIVRELP